MLASPQSPGESGHQPTLGDRVVKYLFRALLDTRANVRIAVKLPNLYWTLRILLQPDILLGQTYVDGHWSVEPEKLFEFLYFIRAQESSRLQGWFLLSKRTHLLRDAIKQRVVPVRATRAVVEHYNTDPLFMSFILGKSLSYTCAFFDQSHSRLDDAQQNKLDFIATRIGLSKDHRVLDLGTGWGYAPFPLAEEIGCHVTGITISEVQVDFCEKRRQESPARDRLTFVCSDYADFSPPGPFDRVISMGMLEHVGKYQYRNFFDRVAEFLDGDGVGLIHSIVERREISPDAWIDRNVFPGGYIPTISEVVEGIESSACKLIAIHTHDKGNYFKTLEAWKNNLFENRSQCEERLNQLGLSTSQATKVIRIWEYFLSTSQVAFSSSFGECQVCQFVISRRR